MSIHKEQILEVSGGFSKEIDSGAQQIVFDLLQKFQYQYPIKSTVREIVSNGLDSIQEKHVARSILMGLSKVEDHFVTAEGAEFKDSTFDPNYYDLAYLSENDFVEVIYVDGGELEKDEVLIRDYGVGLGGNRLAGYFSLGYSSKRLNKFTLGKFGLGAKSPLSTGAPFYTVTSRWNGKEFMFNVYSHRVESIVPKMDLNTGNIYPEYTFNNGYQCHYRNTDEPNMVEIKLYPKKHHKQQYLDAVTSQLMYFPNVKCYEILRSENDYKRETPVKADIIYEDDSIILASNSPYSKPHVVLNRVNYGYLNFQEMELEEKLGNIAIKVDPNEVTVNPSRESLIWDDKTRETVVAKFQQVVSTAEAIINAELKENDFIRWMRMSATALAARSWFNESNGLVNNTIIGRLAKIVDLSKIELSYPNDKRFKFTNSFLAGIMIRHISIKAERKGSKVTKKIEYDLKYRQALEQGLPILVLGPDEMMSNRKNKYYATHVSPAGFITITLDKIPESGTKVTEADIPATSIEDRVDQRVKDREERMKKAAGELAALHNYILESQEYTLYRDVVVPDEFKANDDTDEEVEEDESESAKESAEERRKLKGLTIVHTPRSISFFPQENQKVYEMHKFEVPVTEIDNWSNDEIFWSNDDYQSLLTTAAFITRPASRYDSIVPDPKTYAEASECAQEWKGLGYVTNTNNALLRGIHNFSQDSAVRLVKVSQTNSKYYKDFKHITRFFKEIKNKTITMSTALVKWNTARLIKPEFDKLDFLKGFGPISPAVHEMYDKLDLFINKYYRNMSHDKIHPDIVPSLVEHLDKVGQFQLFVRENPTETEAIAEMVQQLFNPDPGVEIVNGLAIDVEIYDLFRKLVDWSEPVQVMLNMIAPLRDEDEISSQQEEEIRRYFQYRNCPIEPK